MHSLTVSRIYPCNRSLTRYSAARPNSATAYRISYWDAAILASAAALGCDAVYSEDMSDRQDYDGIRVINPFA